MSIIPGTNNTITKQNAIGKVSSVTKDPLSPLAIGRAYIGVKTFKVATANISNADVITQPAHGLSSGDVVIYHSEDATPIYRNATYVILASHVQQFDNSFRGDETVHGWETGQKVKYFKDSGDAADGLANEGVYYVIKVDNYSFKLADSKKNAENGVELNITGDGNDNQHFLTIFNDNEAFWINRASADTFTLHSTHKDAIANTNKVVIRDTIKGNDNQTFSAPFGKFDPPDA